MPDQPWSDIRDLGSVLRHDYDAVAPEITWRIVVDDLPPLKTAIESTLRKLRAAGGED